MTPRLLIARAREPEALRRLERAALTDLTTRYRRGEVLVMSDVEADVALPNEVGGVFGELFSRPEHRRVKTVSVAVAEALAGSGGRELIKAFWGDYIAVLITSDDTVHVVRSPFGAMAVYRLQVGPVEVVTNDVGLLIDLGWLSPAIDWDFTAHFLAYPFLRARRTGFEDLSELPPGSALIFSPGRDIKEQVLWSPWDHVAPHSEPGLAERLRDETRRCVRAWAEDRQRLLLELSGGLDSSILAACLQDVAAEVTCVNMVSPARDGDERIFARAVAERLGLVLHEIELEPRDLDLTAPPAIRRPRPSAHALLGAWDQTLTERARDLGVDAFVSGGGGDNVFFNTHGSAPAADALRRGAVGTWSTAVKDLARLHGCSVWRAGGMSIKRAARSPAPAWRSDRRFMAPAAAGALAEPHPWLDQPVDALPGKLDHIKGLMGAQNYLDGFPRSAQAPLLTPLLSQPIVELCLSIPSWEWIHEGRDRSVARQAFRTALPPVVVDRRSKGNLAGFAGPAFEAARGKLAGHLLGGRLDQAGLLDAASLRSALEETGPPKGSDYFRILQIADVESWARRWS